MDIDDCVYLSKHISTFLEVEDPIIVLNKKSGKPYISIVGKTKKIIDKKFKRKKSKIS